MALIRCNFMSEALELATSMTVVLPQRSTAQIGLPQRPGDQEAGEVRAGEDRAGGGREGRAGGEQAAPPVLYLLHGLTDDDTAWTRYSSIERYAAAQGLAVVMPQVHRSFYADEKYGLKHWTFLSEELPAIVESMFRVSTRREDTFVAGLSMGGYGALKWALRRPERFAAAASLSGALDLAYMVEYDKRPHVAEVIGRVFGGVSPAGTDDDLLHLLTRAGDRLPRLMVRCGTGDHLLPHSERFVEAARKEGVGLEVDFGPGGHDWDYWDEHVQAVLDWLPLER
ncbi:alpha/beta hydrolase [Actinoplanes sp. RD1]|uniref:alpha/beta hydrolase n=1 Tax=Actinoplanes sp. RD1 TaxID=3064538 RepID=UPI0027408AF2|nr:alpha/beta hydrolase family protein [Actinoplanes sp. RD1]